MATQVEQVPQVTGRSWFQAVYSDGRMISEWGSSLPPLIVATGQHSRWESLDKRGLRQLKLVCPNGQVGELTATTDRRFFQIKIGYIKVTSPGTDAPLTTEPQCEAHVIGVVTDILSGASDCWAWEVQERRLIRFADNAYNLTYRGVGSQPLVTRQLV